MPTSKGFKGADSKSLRERFLCTKAALRSSPGLYIACKAWISLVPRAQRGSETSLHVTRKKISKRKGKEKHEGVTGKARKMASGFDRRTQPPAPPSYPTPSCLKSLGKLPIKNLGTSEGCEYVTRLHFASGQSSATWDHESA